MSGHTPGPWEWWTSNSWKRLRQTVRGVSTNVLMPSVLRDGQPTIDVSQEDMPLIAAAPDMLAALKSAQKHINAISGDSELKDKIGAAIAKAEGSAP